MSLSVSSRWLACAALVLTGCLFVGDINSRPFVYLRVDATSAHLGDPIAIHAQLNDDQSVASLQLTVRDSMGNAVVDPCTAQISQQRIDAYETLITAVVWKPGVYTIEAIATDPLGAHGSTATVQVGVSDSAPIFTSGASKPRAGRAFDACLANYLANGPIPIVLDEPAVDPDATASVMPNASECAPLGRPIHYHWRITAQPTMDGTLAPPLESGACPATADAARVTELDAGLTVCFYPDPSLPSFDASSYTVEVFASDGNVDVSAGSLLIPVVGNSPACLDGTYPEVGAYVVASGQPTVFQAIGVDDVDASPSLLYRWSLRKEGDTEYTVVADHVLGADGGGRFELDPVLYQLTVGDKVSLRAEVTEPDTSSLSCGVDDDTCKITSCAAATAMCPRRATWSLELR